MKNNLIILYINSSNSGVCVISISKNKKIFSLKNNILKHDRSNQIFDSIDKLLKKHNSQLSDIDAICVYSGPGAYTSLRVGVSIANSLAWFLDVPLFAIKKEKIFIDSIDHIMRQLDRQKVFNKCIDAYYQQDI
jgi:tRNA threonylcarbamoyladenosine biosynthesis protein TsaB